VFLAIILIELQLYGSENEKGLIERTLLFGLGAQGARIMLSTIAGSMMTIVGITFSMTIVTLALASNQYTSRILRNFMRDRLTQFVIGFFAGVFTYCLIVLCTIRTSEEGEFIPNLAVFVAFLSALGGIGVLIFFIHHIASSIQASNILSSVTNEILVAIDQIYPKELKNEITENDEYITKLMADENWLPILANKTGYLQMIDIIKLRQVARDQKIIVRMEHKIGEFVVKDTTLASLAIDKVPDQETIKLIHSTFLFNAQRTMEQDISFGIRQLVDIALKSLSLGINDTTTGVMCLNYLTAIMVQLASRKFNSSYHYEEDKLRVITQDRNFETLLNESFDQIRENSKDNIIIILKIIESLGIIAGQTKVPYRLDALSKQIDYVSEMVKQNIMSHHNREQINTQIFYFHKLLKDHFSLSQNSKLKI